MKSHNLNRVHPNEIHSILARDRLIKQREYASTYPTTRELKITGESNLKTNGSKSRVWVNWGDFLDINSPENNSLKNNSPVKLSSAETVSAPSGIIDFKSNLLEHNYQFEYLWSNQKGIKLKILVVEDKDDSRDLLCLILRSENFQVVEAKDSNTAIKLAQSELPDLIICELMMPIIDGYGIMHLLRQSKITSKIPLLFITAYSEETDVGSKRILIADKGIIEPLTTEKLLTAIIHRVNMTIAVSGDGLGSITQR